EFESAFAAMERDRPDAVIVQPSLPTKRAAELALQQRLPAFSVPRWFAEQGGLMSYSAIYADLFRKAAVYVDKILKGAQPADLPVEQPTRSGVTPRTRRRSDRIGRFCYGALGRDWHKGDLASRVYRMILLR